MISTFIMFAFLLLPPEYGYAVYYPDMELGNSGDVYTQPLSFERDRQDVFVPVPVLPLIHKINRDEDNDKKRTEFVPGC